MLHSSGGSDEPEILRSSNRYFCLARADVGRFAHCWDSVTNGNFDPVMQLPCSLHALSPTVDLRRRRDRRVSLRLRRTSACHSRRFARRR